jgi:hypothetical protein
MRARRLTVLLVLVAVGATACGSSSKGAASGTTSTTTSNTPAASSGASTSAATTTTTKVSGDSGSSFCNLVRSDVSAIKSTNYATTSPTDLKKLYQNLGPALSDAESKAPSAIKADFHTFVTAFTPIFALLKNANYDYTKISPSDYATFASMGTPQVKAASDHVEQYVTQVCHVATTSST